VSGALEALRAAMESGDVQALAPAYARNAVLDAGLPGGRVRHLGRAAIVDELGRWWDELAQVGEWTVRSWPTGAALTVERDGVRRRHYLHLSGDLIARHWIYAMAPRPGRDATVPGEVLAALGDGARREAAAFAGNSGAGIERVLLGDGTALIMKRVVAGGDWLGRATGGRARTAELWHAGVLARVPPEIDHAIVTVLPDPVEGWWVAMRDVSAAMLGDERRLSRDESRRVLAAAAALHAAFAGESVEELCPLADRLVATSGLRVADDEREGTDVVPKQ
jgi:hypothetical protein